MGAVGPGHRGDVRGHQGRFGEEHGVSISVHAPYFINLNATDDEWPKSRKRLMDAAHYGNLAGATDIVFHPGSYFGNPPEDVLKIAIPRPQGVRGGVAAGGKSRDAAAGDHGQVGHAGFL